MTGGGPAQLAHAPVGTLQPIAVVRSYDDLRRAVADHCERIGMTRMELDAQAGIADGNAAKALARRVRKRLGWITLARILAATGLALQVVIDPEMQAPPQARPTRIPRKHWRHTRGSAWGKRMAARRALKLTAEQRSNIGRTAANARWRRRQAASQTDSSNCPSSPRST